MLERVDRIQMAVADAAVTARAFQDLLGAEPAREEDSDYLNARRTILTLGASEVELCVPRGAGLVRAHLDRWGPGLLTAGFSVASVPALRAHLVAEGVEFTREGEQTYLEPSETAGMRVVVSPAGPARRLGLVSHLYEVTNTLVSPWAAAAERYTRLFKLDPSRFAPIRSERFGYVGTLTLFDPPGRLDRIEISQVTDPQTAMGRWAARRGDSLYMCYAETPDVGAIVRRLEGRHARFTPRGGDPEAERDGLWIHPSALGGLLLGISRTTVAWEWTARARLRLEEPIVIDLFSDTLTKPTPEMRRFMCEAEVGDEQKGEDPTVTLLQEMVAELLGKEAAVYLPSGTMCNEIAVKVHTRPGDEVLADRTSHLIHFEGGGPGLLSGVLMTALDGDRGVFTGAQVRAGAHARSRYAPPTRLVSIENTSNLGGGRVWPLAAVQDVGAAARALGLATHMDGARLLNAVVASGTPARAYAGSVDSAWIDFSKGLGAPVGACLAGTRAFIEEAWRYKQALGGAMRQAGIIAAGGVYALRHHVDRLAQDHEHARILARGIADLPGIALDPAHVETNIVIFDVTAPGLTAAALADRLLADAQVRLSVMGERRLRAVTHLDVSRKQVEAAVEAMARALRRS